MAIDRNPINNSDLEQKVRPLLREALKGSIKIIMDGNQLKHFVEWKKEIEYIDQILKKLDTNQSSITKDDFANKPWIISKFHRINKISLFPEEQLFFILIDQLVNESNDMGRRDIGLNKNGNVIRIRFSETRLPLLPLCINKLQYLEELDLGWNQIIELPPSLVDLKSLKFLNLNSSKLIKPFSDEMQKILAELRKNGCEIRE